MLQRRRRELGARSGRAPDLVGSELVRFDSASTPGVRVPTDAGVLVEQTLVTSGRSTEPLTVGGAGGADRR